MRQLLGVTVLVLGFALAACSTLPPSPLPTSNVVSPRTAKAPIEADFPVVRADGTKIEAWYRRPNIDPAPIVLMLQGSNCGAERDSFAALTQDWQNSYALVYIAKPGDTLTSQPCGPTYLERNTIDQRLEDSLAIIRQLRRQSWWDGKLYLIGGSEGGLMAGLIASHVPETTKVAILSYGGGLTMGEWWPQTAYEGVLLETRSEEAAQKERNEVLETFARARAQPTSKEVFSGDSNTLAWWASIIDRRLSDTLLKVDIPILLVHGERDQMAPVTGARILNEQSKAAGKHNLTYWEYANLDHGFVDTQNKSQLEEVMDRSLIWLLGPKDQ